LKSRVFLARFEHDNCGRVYLFKGIKSTLFITLDVLVKLEHRGAVSADGTGDGAGILLIFHTFFKKCVTLIFTNKGIRCREWFSTKEKVDFT
jgi:glutamate synthase (ferredoxin)